MKFAPHKLILPLPPLFGNAKIFTAPSSDTPPLQWKDQAMHFLLVNEKMKESESNFLLKKGELHLLTKSSPALEVRQCNGLT